MTPELLRATEVGRRLGVSTRVVVDALYRRELRYVLHRGIPHIPSDALEEYRNRSS